MKVTTTFKADYEFQSTNEEGNSVDIDMYSPEKKEHMSPTQLLLSALSACASVDLVQMLKKRKRTVNGLTVVADGTRKDDHPRAFTHIVLTFTVDSPDVTQEEFEKMGHLAATKYCSVAGTLNCQVDHHFVINR
uniref:OsmC family protein n=1 Tax=Roseivirga sp. TaxID=1964215 RepID=UPI0040477A9E